MSYVLHWLAVQPTHYNDFLFRSLAADPEIDLTVHVRKQGIASHPWKTKMGQGFKSRNCRRVLGLDWHLLSLGLRAKNSFFVIAGWNEPEAISLISLLSARGRPFAVWTDTPWINRPRSSFKAVVRSAWLKWILGLGQNFMSTGKPGLAALSQMGCPPEKLINFPFAVDLGLFSPATHSPSREGGIITFLSSGQLIKKKGHDLALSALAQARDRLNLKPDRFRYRLAGTGPDQDKLIALAQRLGLKDQVEFVGWLEPAQLPDFYRSGQVLLHPSHRDPYPNAILEAMACGLTVIGSDTAGSAVDRIRPGENGLIHRAGDVQDLTDNLMLLFKDPEKIMTMGAKARATAAEWPVSRQVDIVKRMLGQCA